ncbi:MAG: hypothetical protein BWX88_01071 [Planctomycetes bacterium ADurb.Bin126]|nr:MAG: hypothetical protein BWX88_01071 [Planctomycetes bacterium ADurb.Bin126]HOD80444.1 hypothetical protein [Phycisphaerae bacterium]HQL72758.1 hypothetical protein [Phycisphaerae bacterium]
MKVTCSKCGREFDCQGADSPVAVIAQEVMGDEYIESFFFCQACGVYTQESYHDRFLGEDSVAIHGPIDKTRGDELVELIRQCPDPTNKKCKCPIHQKHF